MKPIKKELDRLVQQLSHNHLCHICRKPSTEIHHIISRANPLLRYNFPNLLPVCYDCHRAIHDDKIDLEKRLPAEIWNYLQDVKNKSYKDYLLYIGKTEDEYLKEQREILRNAIGKNETSF